MRLLTGYRGYQVLGSPPSRVVIRNTVFGAGRKEHAMANTENDWRDIEPRGKRKWTVMVYMAAENTTELDAVAIADLREMEQGVTDDTPAHVVVQINRAWPAAPQRYEITHDKSTLVGVAENKNMGREITLTKFLTGALKNFPADNYCLVLWGHAFGLGFGRDHNDKLTLNELTIALKHFKENHPEKRKLDLLGANACALSYAEAAYELRESASFLVASQIAVPFAGWPYKTILSRINEKTDAAVLGRLIVDAYVTHYNALLSGERVAMSLLNLEKAKELPSLLGELTTEINEEIAPGGTFSSVNLDYVRDTFISTAAGEVRPLIDLQGLCEGFRDANSQSLVRFAHKVPARLEPLLMYRNSHPDLSDLTGIGIFTPFITDEYDLKRLGLQDSRDDDDEDLAEGQKKKTGKEEYQELALSQAVPAWPRLVYNDLRREIPAGIMESLTSIGASARADRRDIAQIVLGIESSFNKLDRILAEARKCVQEELEQVAMNEDGKRERGAQEVPLKHFGPPWLKLIRPTNLAGRVAFLKNLIQLKALEQAVAGGPQMAATVAGLSGSISERDLTALLAHMKPIEAPPDAAKAADSVIGFFMRVENAVGDVERATRRGLTNAKFGLGPNSPTQFNIGLGDISEQPKSEMGDISEQPKSEMGDISEQPKSEMGPSSRRTAGGIRSGDLRVDLAFARVVELFSQVGGALRQLEEATLEIETVARGMLIDAQVQDLTKRQLLDAARDEIDRAFRVLQEAATTARRTVRQVLAHPVYGVGPASGVISLDDRQALAAAGGLDRRSLRLL
jgi:Clostripain family